MDDDADSGDTGWQPPASSVPSPAPGPPSSERGDAAQGRVVGWARSVQMRSEQDPNDSNRQFTVLTFDVERFDEAGNRLPPIPVQMRGFLDGAITEGAEVEVEVAGAEPRDGTLHVDWVLNKTSGAVVRVKGTPHWKVWVFAVFAAIFVVVMIFTIVNFFTNEPPSVFCQPPFPPC